MLCALGGTTWFLQFFFYGMGKAAWVMAPAMDTTCRLSSWLPNMWAEALSQRVERGYQKQNAQFLSGIAQ